MEETSQDGMKVRASAGGSSFRRIDTLKDHVILSENLIADLKKEANKKPSCISKIISAQLRFAKEKNRNVKKAIEEQDTIAKEKEAQLKKDRRKFKIEDRNKIRTSVTDPEARIMKMPDGGFRPAYNVQFATTNLGKAIIGVFVTNQGSDSELALEMLEQIKNRYCVDVKTHLIDSGYNAHLNIEEIEKKFPNCSIYSPIKPAYENKIKNDPKKSVQDYVMRMESEEGKKSYKMRSETAEFSNARARNNGLQQFLVRSLNKVLCSTLIYSITHNMQILFGHI